MLIAVGVWAAGMVLHAGVGLLAGDLFGGVLVLCSPIWPLFDAYMGWMCWMDHRMSRRAKKAS